MRSPAQDASQAASPDSTALQDAAPEMALTLLSTYNNDEEVAEAMRISPALLYLTDCTALPPSNWRPLPTAQHRPFGHLPVYLHRKQRLSLRPKPRTLCRRPLQTQPQHLQHPPHSKRSRQHVVSHPHAQHVVYQLPLTTAGQFIMPVDRSTAQQPAASSSDGHAISAPQPDMIQVPVRGRDVPHSSDHRSRNRSTPRQTGGHGT